VMYLGVLHIGFQAPLFLVSHLGLRIGARLPRARVPPPRRMGLGVS
jgi:hypothetical protein